MIETEFLEKLKFVESIYKDKKIDAYQKLILIMILNVEYSELTFEKAVREYLNGQTTKSEG